VVDKARRKSLSATFRQSSPEAGVYRIVNRRTGRFLLSSTANLAGLRSRFEFASSTNSPGALDSSLREDIAGFGFESFSFEVHDDLEIKPDMTPAQIAEDLATLEALWREKTDRSLLY